MPVTTTAPYIRLRFELPRSPKASPRVAIIAAVKRELAVGQLPSGSRLPPVRVLQHQLGISKNTAQNAYEELVAQGIVETRHRQGYFIAKSEHSARRPALTVAAAPMLYQVGVTRPAVNVKTSKPMLDLGNVFIDPQLLPMERVAECMRAVLRQPGLHAAYDLQGFAPLRNCIAARLVKRGIPARGDDVIITTGSQQALDIATRALRRRAIATENPAYGIAKQLFELNQMQVTGLPFNPFTGVDMAQWRRLIAKQRPAALYLTTNFHNPTGYSYSSAELAAILQISHEYQCGLIEDDWGSEMLSYSDFRPSLRALGGENVLYMNSFTKKLLPSLRLGYLLANAASIEALLLAKKVSTLANPSVVEMALFEFLDRGYYDVHLRALQRELDARYHVCLATLAAVMPTEVRWTTPGGGPLLWLELPSRVDLQRLTRRMQQQHISLDTRTQSWFFGKPHLHGVKIGYAFLPSAALQRGLEALAKEIRRELH